MGLKISEKEGIYLVNLARRTIENLLEGKLTPETLSAPLNLMKKAGVFVTLLNGEGKNSLRGCIGLPYPLKPLVESVIEAAQGAAFRDPRFSPVNKNEIDEIIIEVSVLTPPELINVKQPSDLPGRINVGKDGLIIQNNQRSGLLLPQVPVDWGWDSEEFLCQCCRKAWLPMDAWLLPETKVLKFNSIIFKEEYPKGPVKKLEL
jgi:uncharacterized protein (TIGR00296 family)